MYEVKRNRSSFHIDGIAARSQGTGTDTGRGHVSYFAETTCGALTRGQFATVKQTEDIAEALAEAQLSARINNKNMCKNCTKAAEELIAQQ